MTESKGILKGMKGEFVDGKMKFLLDENGNRIAEAVEFEPEVRSQIDEWLMENVRRQRESFEKKMQLMLELREELGDEGFEKFMEENKQAILNANFEEYEEELQEQKRTMPMM